MQMTQEISHKVNSENTIRDLSMITGSEETDPLSMGALREAVMQMGEDLMGNKEADGDEGRPTVDKCFFLNFDGPNAEHFLRLLYLILKLSKKQLNTDTL